MGRLVTRAVSSPRRHHEQQSASPALDCIGSRCAGCRYEAARSGITRWEESRGREVLLQRRPLRRRGLPPRRDQQPPALPPTPPRDCDR